MIGTWVQNSRLAVLFLDFVLDLSKWHHYSVFEGHSLHLKLPSEEEAVMGGGVLDHPDLPWGWEALLGRQEPPLEGPLGLRTNAALVGLVGGGGLVESWAGETCFCTEMRLK